MKILNARTYSYSSQISQYPQKKVIETNDGFILNTVYHNDKKALNATTQQIYNSTYGNGDLQTRMALDRFIDRADAWLNPFCDGIITDKYNEDIYYTYDRYMLMKYSEKNGIIETIKISQNIFGGNIYQYIGQTENYLFFSYHTNSNNKYIYKMDKNTFAVTTVYTYYMYNTSYDFNTIKPIVLKETSIAIYMLVLRTNTTSAYAVTPVVLKIDKITEDIATLVTLTSFTCSSNSYIIYQGILDCIQVSETNFYVILKTPNNTLTADGFMSYVSIDISDETNVTATVGNMAITGDFVAPTNKYYTLNAPVFIWTYTYNEKQYLYMLRKYYASTNTSYSNYNYLYAFEIIKNSNTNVPSSLKFISLKEDTNFYNANYSIERYMLSKDKSILFLTHNTSAINIYKFDPVTLSYEFCNTLTVNYHTFGLDSLNRLWILDNYCNVNVYGLTDYSSYALEFEKPEYAYEGVDIETYVKFKCFDMTKSRVNGTFNLTIQGAAKFVENYDTNLTVTLSEDDTEDLQVPIIITGGGRILVYPTLISS